MSTLDNIKNAIANQMKIDENTITADSTLETLKIDSLDMVEIVMSLEDELGITLEGVENIKTVQELADAVSALQNK